MSALINISTLTSMYEAYIRAGFALVPIISGKGPTAAGWNKRVNCVTDVSRIDCTTGYGLAHAYSGTCAIDIDAWTDALALLSEHGIDLNALYTAPDAVTIDSGNPGHGKLIYAMPFGLTLPSKKITDASGKVVYELRCASANGLTVQDVLPSALNHPKTGTPYRWSGNGHFSNLPILPVELLTLWQSLVSKDSERTITNGTIDASWDEIKSALFAISPECSRDDWLSCLMALHYAGTQSDQEAQAFHLADDWSSQAPTKYKGKQDIIAVWKSLRAHPDGVKLGTLFHIAAQYGWKRPTPDVSALFKKMEVLKPSEIIDSLRYPAPDIDMSLFPPLLRQIADEVSIGIGCDPLVPLWAAMAAICGAVDARTRLEIMPGFKVPPVLWVMTIGDPAEKKTPGSTPVLEPLTDIERQSMPQFRRDHRLWEALDAAHSKSMKSYLEAAANPDFMLNQQDTSMLPTVADEAPKPPVPKRIVVKDITSQKLVRMVAERPEGVLCHLDEMSGWVTKVTDPKSGDDRSTWTIAYEAKPHVIDRVGEQNSIPCENYAVSIYGNIQPAVYRKAMRAMADDGLLQRFIPVPLRQKQRPLGQPVPDMLSARSNWVDLLNTIHKNPVMTYTPDFQAYTAYREFQAWYERNKQDERILQADNLFLTAYGKLEGLVGRIALTMHLASDPLNPILSYSTMNSAIVLIRTYVISAYRFALSEISGSVEQSLDIWVLKHIVQISEETREITLGDLRRAAKRQIEGMMPAQAGEALRYSMGLLERSGWVIETESTPKRTTWAINPDIATAHDGYRLEVIKAKQRQLDDSWAIIKANGYPEAPRILARGYDPTKME